MPESNPAPVIETFVAIGDSFTEGLADQAPGGGLRGWADMVAAALAAQRPGFRYANLAIRGKLLRQVAAEQLPRAVEMAPDLVSLAAGGNDILRGDDVDTLAADFEPAVAKLQAAGCRVLIFTGFDPRMFPVIRLLRGRIAAYNMHLRGIADDYGCDLVDLWSMRALKDPRAWSPDRLHLTTQGHRQVALRTCAVLGIPPAGDWAPPPPARPPAAPGGSAPGNSTSVTPVPGRSAPAPLVRAGLIPAGQARRAEWLAARRQDARWAREYATPWLRRRLTGTSSGDGLSPKRPDLLPV
ncbi:MAG TPA: SGNH/GDSL hydrolase family protein [Streptosporangiaceae bacterium]|nr:SGNH/GDSL hydrolase family protein [Streptosporangiaceae bacterium]